MSGILTKLWLILHFPKKIQLWIIRLFHDEFLVGVAGVIFNQKDEILLFKHTYREIGWGLPGGYMKAKEHPMEGLEREIEEESGFIVSIDEPIKIRTDRETARLEVCYIGEYLGGEFKKSGEVSKADFFTFENLPLIPRKQIFLIDYALKKRKKSRESKWNTSSNWSFINKFKTIRN